MARYVFMIKCQLQHKLLFAFFFLSLSLVVTNAVLCIVFGYPKMAQKEKRSSVHGL